MVARDCSVSYSTDNGVTWTETNPVPFESQVPYGICFGNGKYVVVGANGKIAYSFPE
jgi:hypothetical protein